MIPKFRAYSKADNAIYKVLLIDFKSSIEQIKLKKTGEIWYDFEDIILMQSTGLHDKHGIEIFEGDLIHYTYEGFYWYVPVVYRESRFEVYHGTLSTIPASKIPSGKYATNIGNSIRMYRAEFTDMYVAGNIYENPELLEDV